jgi:hypothetical protein
MTASDETESDGEQWLGSEACVAAKVSVARSEWVNI